jgi:uroporphyrinogen decarboxylase
LLRPEEWQDWELADGTPAKIPAYFHPVKVGKHWHVYDEDGTLIAIQKEGCHFFEQMCWPLAGSQGSSFDHLASDLKKIMWVALDIPPHPIPYNDPEALAALSAAARSFRESTDRAIIAPFGGNLHDIGMMGFGMAEWFVLLAAEPARVHRFLDRLMDLYMENLPKFLATVGPSIDIILFADDLGTQMGPMFSPRMYREYFLPRHKLLWETAKKLADVKVALHCCGGVYSLLPGLIEAGLDILNPVQTTARDMEPERLKREFGKDLCFWGGGCDTQDVLPRGTPQQVADDVRRRVSVFAPGGGFLFNQIHNILPEVPPENIAAMFEAVRALS